MKIATSPGEDPGPLRDERELIAALPLPLSARALELGCGTARQTRALLRSGKFDAITALEVDTRQHALNLLLDDLPGVSFGLGGAEAIPATDASVDAVFLFKSLHHVPMALLDQAFAEMRRVLKPGGLLYISEPIFGGDYNEILRLFHDEQAVRQAAFDATVRAVDARCFELVGQTFFLAPVRYRSFDEFERAVIGVTHTEHHLSAALHRQVRERFDAHMTEQGAAFEAPFRVDLLRRPTG
ncbi:class I SAM-dependent methyltransferase [Duganella aceris]|uniref:Class I SAM-dependent methyltransferase n=1 Tax=Duganella aceris TaxID=2703883 RepID=A0ABX0FL88_9BURK|nr:class I SAM-dependent methyltransferase [Duganella aceris]NGZ85277.1 class I SAM-dependent methyltransferase [Duganella aceris]